MVWLEQNSLVPRLKSNTLTLFDVLVLQINEKNIQKITRFTNYVIYSVENACKLI